MKEGVEGVTLPGELYHQWYVETDHEQTMVWPDLILLAKNGYQIPDIASTVASLLHLEILSETVGEDLSGDLK